MTSRRAPNNRIRGPQSALTDFLAANNISAAQINADYERRQAEARQHLEHEAAEREETLKEDHQMEVEPGNGVNINARKRRRQHQSQKNGVQIKYEKIGKRKKKRQADTTDDEDTGWDLSVKKKSLPGQLENCEACEKRFTVTPYSKTGPEGGLLCSKCSKEQDAVQKKDEKAKKLLGGREKRRQIQSKLLDGVVQVGSKSLQELCIKEVADNINDVEEFGDLPESLLKRLSQILSRRRVITSRTLDLFLRPDLETINIYDCGKLEFEDYVRLFQIVPRVQNINLQNAGQFKDKVVDFMIEREVPVKRLQLEAANLVSNSKWIEYFTCCGHRLEYLKLSWLDNSMDDEAFAALVHHCPNLKRLKMKKCFKLSSEGLRSMSRLKNLEHLSLDYSGSAPSQILIELISAVGPNLQTLSLQNFVDADDQVLNIIHTHCSKLQKLRFTGNDYCTDAGFAALFSEWRNSPLSVIDFSSNRSIDYSAPSGPEDPIGVASAGFSAIMKHSASSVRSLDISSCRHIDYETFAAVFTDGFLYPLLQEINISFLPRIDTSIVAGMFKSCPRLIKVTAFGCFNVRDITVPKGVALIGLPQSQDFIMQEGSLNTDLWLLDNSQN